MRILHFIDTLGVGGAETLLKDTILHYKKAFPEDTHFVMTLYRGGGYEEIIRKEARYTNLNFSPLSFIPRFITFRKYLRDNKIDIVHSHLNESTIIARFFTPENVRLVSSYHSGYLKPGAWNYSKKRLLAERLPYRKKHYCLFVSDSVANDTIDSLKLKGNYEVLKNFYDSRFEPAYEFKDDSKLRLVTVGNLSRQKNQLLVLKTLKALNTPEISLDIFGEGSLRQELQSYIEAHKLKVNLMGRHFITSELLGRYDAFIMSSLNEGFGIALVEAMASGLPSILPDVPALMEVAGDSALIYENNSVEALTIVLRQVLHDKSIVKGLSEKAIHLSSNYSVEKNISQLNRVYKKVLSQ